MTLPISSTQLDLAARAVTDSVWLFVLTTYSDKNAGTVSNTYYWTHTDSMLAYDYGGSGDVQFLPVVVNKPGSTLGAAVPRIADRSPSDRQALLVELDNSPVQDASGNILHAAIWEDLIGENLHGADLVVSELLVNPHLRVNASTPWWDLRSLSGTDHTIRFRGECVQVEPVGSTVPLRFAHVEPEVPFVTLLDQQNNHPEDFGSRLPVIVGQAKGVECKRIKVGAVTTVSQTIDATFTGDASVTDPTLFPEMGSFSIWLNGEEIACTGSDHTARTVAIATRAQNGTTAQRHQAGSVLVELVDEMILGISGSPISALDRLELLNPFSGEWALIETPYQVVPNDTTAIPGSTIATVRMQQDDLRSLLAQFFVTAQVSVQPEFDGDTAASPGATTTVTLEPSSPTVVTDLSAQGAMTASAPPVYTGVSGSTSTRQRLEWTFASGDLSGLGSNTVKRWRLVQTVEEDATYGGTGSTTVRSQNISGIGADSTTVTVAGSGDIESGASPWRSPASGTTISHLTGKKVIATGKPLGSFGQAVQIDFNEVGVEVEYWTTLPSGTGDVAIFRTIDTLIEAASQSFSARFRCDAQGATVPGTFTDEYEWDEGTGWSTSDLTQTNVTGPPTAQDFELTANIAVHACDALNDGGTSTWTGFGGGTVSLETTIKNEGTGSVKLVGNTTTDACRLDDVANTNYGAAWDCDEHYLAFDLFVADNAATKLNHIEVGVTSDSSWATTSQWKGWRLTTLDPDFEMDEWRTIILDTSRDDNGRGAGTLVHSSLFTFNIQSNVPAYGGGNNACTLYVDNFRLIEKAGVAQRNATTGTVDLESAGDVYTLKMVGTNVNRLGACRVLFENTAGSGTTKPTTYRQLTISGGQLTEGSESAVDASVLDVGGPSFDNVETIRVELEHNGSGPEVPSVEIRAIQVADASNANYTLAPGTLIENPADVDRWFIADFCGLGHAAVGSTNSAFKTSMAILGKMGGNLTGLGERFAEIRGSYLYEARASGYEIETAAGTVYQVRVASLAHTWGLVDETLAKTDYESVTEQLPDVTELGNSFQAFWSYRPTLGFGENAFAQVSVTNPNESDAILTPGDATAMVAARVRFGPRKYPPLGFVMIQDANAAADTLGFYAYMRSEEKFATYRLTGVPNWKAFALEPGDIVSIALRGTSRTVSKAEVLSCQRAPGSMTATLVCGGVE